MNSTVLVSVVIPCYNVESYIRDCVESVFQQKYTSLEIICVDDGSHDRTTHIIQELIQESVYPIMLVELEHQGSNHARNMGLKSASGEYIQFLDADDLLKPEKIEQQVHLIHLNPGCGVIAGSFVRHRMDGTPIVERKLNAMTADLWTDLVTSKLGITSSNLWSRQALNAVGGWNTSYKSSQEYELLFRLLKLKTLIVTDPQISTIIRERASGSISQINVDDNFRRHITLRVDMMVYMQDQNLRINSVVYTFVWKYFRILSETDLVLALDLLKKINPKSLSSSIYYYKFLLKIYINAYCHSTLGYLLHKKRALQKWYRQHIQALR